MDNNKLFTIFDKTFYHIWQKNNHKSNFICEVINFACILQTDTKSRSSLSFWYICDKEILSCTKCHVANLSSPECVSVSVHEKIHRHQKIPIYSIIQIIISKSWKVLLVQMKCFNIRLFCLPKKYCKVLVIFKFLYLLIREKFWPPVVMGTVKSCSRCLVNR